MERVFCDVCNRDITRGCFMRSPDTLQVITVDTGYGTVKMELCQCCWKRLLYLVQNDRCKAAIQNMGFMNRMRLALMHPIKFGDEEE